MKLGTSVALLLIGAVLAFAVKDNVSSVDLTTIGYITMGAGALLLILSLVMGNKTVKSSHRESVVGSDGVNRERVVNSEGSAPPAL